MAKTELFVRKQSGGMFAVANEGMTTGDIFFVDSGSSTGSDGAGYGQNPDTPVVTLDYAVGLCTANNGDRIYIMAGHAETLAAAAAVAIDVAGLTIIGQGHGADRPEFTFSATDSTITITAANTWLENIVIIPSIDAVVSPIVISAADCTLKDIEVQDASAAVECEASVLTTASADRLTVNGFIYRGYIAGNAATRVLALVGVDGAEIKNSVFYGEVSTAVINFETTACHNITVKDCVFYNDNGALSKNVVDTVTGSTWQVNNCFDGKGGYRFSGGSAAALASDDVGAINTLIGAETATTTDSLHGKIGTDAEMADNSLYDLLGSELKTDSLASILYGVSGMATWPAAAQAADAVSLAEAIRYITANQLPQFATATSAANLTDADLWTFTGSVEIIHLIGRVTTVHPAAANTCKLTITPDAFAAYDICGATDLTGMDAGTLLSITGTAAGALVVTDARGAIAPGQANSVVATCVTTGKISTVFSDTGNQNGAIAWEMVWRPISAGATVT